LISKDDRPAGVGRPSLLSTEQGAADGRSVLGALDGNTAKAAKPPKPVNKPAPAGVAATRPKRGRGLALWGSMGVGVLVLAGGALAWMASVPDDESVAAAEPAAVAQHAATPSAASVTNESDVSTAAILNDTAAAKAPAEKLPSLRDMLAAPVAKAAPRHDPLTQALEQPSPKAVPPQPEKPQPAQKTAKAEPKKKPAKEKPKAAPQPKPQDKDAAVLAVLMANAQPSGPIQRKSTPAQQLKSCHQYNAAGAEQCRVRLCSNIAKHEPECKARNKGKAASDS
jgi:outer membrane biosynthesis protein TonB